MKWKKRAISVLLTGCIVLSTVPAAAAVDVVQSLQVGATSGYCGDPNVNDGKNVTWTLDDSGTLTISGAGEMCDYYNGGIAPWKEANIDIRKAIIQSGVTSIGYEAFWGCKSLTSIEIPDSVTKIEGWAFRASGLTSIEIPNSVTDIGQSVFASCDGLTSIEIPDSITSIGYEMFKGCDNLTSVKIPNSVTIIGTMSFDECRSLENIEIPNSVTSIKDRAFYYCTNLTSIEIPNSVAIGSQAFSGCRSLTSIYFKGHVPVPMIDRYGFRGVKATAYYPADDDTWTEDVRQNYGGEITWKTWNPATDTPDTPSGDEDKDFFEIFTDNNSFGNNAKGFGYVEDTNIFGKPKYEYTKCIEYGENYVGSAIPTSKYYFSKLTNGMKKKEGAL